MLQLGPRGRLFLNRAILDARVRSVCLHRIDRSAFSASFKADATHEQQQVQPEPFGDKTNAKYGTFKKIRRLFFVSGAISFSLAVMVFIGFESVHQWVELFEMPATLLPTEEDKTWGWGSYQEDWTGGETGGTDPALGFKVRHLLRAAWMAQHWGMGLDATKTKNTLPQMNNSQIARASVSAQFLGQAVALLDQAPKVHVLHASHQLWLLYGQALEKTGDPDSIIKARDIYVRLWRKLEADLSRHVEVARLANKLGQISTLMHQEDSAIEWWLRALDYNSLAAPEPGSNLNVLDHIPLALPPLPEAQREVISTLMYLLAHFTMTGKMKEAGQIAEATRQLISTASTSWNDSKSDSGNIIHPAAMLHRLFLQHRASVLTMRSAEISYALTSTSVGSNPRRPFTSKDSAEAWQKQLYHAATTAEYVFRSTANSPPSAGDTGHFTQSFTLAPAFRSSLRLPATQIQREAQRTAAEAWNLLGVLIEAQGNSTGAANAIECFERAVAWTNVEGPVSVGDLDGMDGARDTYIANLGRVQRSRSV